MNNKNRFKRRYTKKKINPKNKNFWRYVLKFIKWAFILFIVFSLLISFILYEKYIKELPSIQELENLDIAESSTIYDRDWNELYKIFKEKRTYISYEDISQNMINAIVSWEDKRFWENPWIDLIWLTRAVLYRIIWKSDRLEGTSTLTQQLIRNTIISQDRKIERKVKEMYLAYKLSKWLSKEKILELYLNKISFWSNAFWIEQAAKTFFNKNASSIDILESSILASIPKWPSYFSPYNYPDRLLWYLYSYDLNSDEKSEEEDINKIIWSKTKEENISEVNIFTDYINSLKAKRITSSKTLVCWIKKEFLKNDLKLDWDWCYIVDYSELLSFLNNIKIDLGNEKYLEYQTWRKDFILWRLLEDDKINFDEYKEALIWSIGFDFKAPVENIKYPHFVFFVKEYLEEKYWKDLVEAGWLKVYTTLDPKMQEKAQELVEKYSEINKDKFDANNAALISIDNKTWQIISMIWWKDYFDIENKWNVNIITSKLQPWSSFKPFVYSLALNRNEIWTKTPVYDLETNFPSYKPANFDWKFMWKMNISTALNNSRNIPAIKMFYLAWWEDNIIDYLNSMWVSSLEKWSNYWAPLALWTWEMTPLELAWAYSVFANMWEKKEITPILKVVDSKWVVMEEYKEEEWEKVIEESEAYIINSILSDTSSRPEWWNSFLSLKSRTVWAKTWTSTKQYEKWWRKIIYPRNLWTAGYTPQITTVVRAWNTDWEELNLKWNWLEWAGPIWRDFMEFYHQDKEVLNWQRPSWVKELNISSISWLLPSPENPINNFLVKSLFINAPENYDNSFKKVEIDKLCMWKVSENTPKDAIGYVNLIEFHSLNRENPAWENPVQKWVSSWEYKENMWNNLWNVVTTINEKECIREQTNSSIEIWSLTQNGEIFFNGSNYIEIWYRSDNPIIKLEILIWNDKIKEININNQKQWVYKWAFNIWKEFIWENTITIKAIDNLYYSNSETKSIVIKEKDSTPPDIKITNPVDLSIKLYDWDYFNLRWEVSDRVPIRTINIYINWKTEKIWILDRRFVYEVDSAKLNMWNNSIKIEAVDMNFNKSFKEVKVEKIEK